MNVIARNLLMCSLLVSSVPLLAGCPEDKPTVGTADAGAKPSDPKSDAGARTATDGGATTAGDAGSTTTSDGGTAQNATDAGPAESLVKADELKKIKPKSPASLPGTAWSDGASPAADGVVTFTLKKGTQSLVDARIEDCRTAAMKVEAICAKPGTTTAPAVIKDAAKWIYGQRAGSLVIKLSSAKDDKGKALTSMEELEKLVKESFDVDALAKL